MQQPGAEEEDDRERDLGDDKHLAHAVADPAWPVRAVRLQRFVRIGARGLKAGRTATIRPAPPASAALHASTRTLSDASRPSIANCDGISAPANRRPT